MEKFNSRSAAVKTVTKLAKGFTIVELVVTIAIAGILAAIALPSLNSFLVVMRVDNEVSEMHRLLLTARNSAINTGLNTTVCPLNTSLICTDNWGNDISVFTNTTVNTDRMEGNDTLIKIKSAIKVNDKLQFSSTEPLIYIPSGRALTSVASRFSYCPFQYSDESNGIDVSASGRTYIGTRNAAGNYTDRASNLFTCT
ncbi:MAG: GspH/FimT family protein [Cognaticolwellia sp.]|jgi:type IV fimbrial biogenesis protein FimT/type IV fimbrial biogenesis protein FimU